MAIDERPNETQSSPPSPNLQSSLLRWWRLSVWVIALLILGSLGVMEAVVHRRREYSVEQIKSWVQTTPPRARFRLVDLDAQLKDAPLRNESKHRGTLRVIYTWPGPLRKYSIRAQVAENGNIIYVDTDQDPAEDFMTPFLVANDTDGVRVIRSGEPPLSHMTAERPVNLLTEAGSVFAKPKTPLISAIVIFPALDHKDRITASGPALSMTAQNSLVFTTRARMSLDPRLVRRTLTEAECWMPGVKLDASRIDLCLKMIGATDYAVPRIEQRDGKWHIHLDLHRTAEQEPIRREFQTADLNQVPGVIALGLFDHLGEMLSPEERSAVAAPQFRLSADAEYFSSFKPNDMRSQAHSLKFHDRLLVPNPLWIAAWDFYLDSPSHLHPQQPRVRECPTISAGLEGAASGASQGNFLALLKLAPVLRGEPLYHLQLVRSARMLENKILIGQMLTTWKAEDNSYPSRMARAQELILLQQFQLAQDDLEQALVLQPQSLAVHLEMIRVAAGLNQSWEQIHQHFEKVISLDPDNRQAWQYIMEAVWTGNRTRQSENVDALFDFANECLDGGRWDLVIPQQVPDLLRDIAYDVKNKQVDFTKFQNPKHWQVMEKFYRLAQQADLSPEIRRHVQACFAHDAAITGHFAEAAPVFDLLELPYTPPIPANPLQAVVDPAVSRFGGLSRYAELRDKVRAAVRSGATASN